jgi:hypothetical protein
VKLKKFVPAKIVKNRATAACFIFDCPDEKNNCIPVSENDMDDIKDSIEGLPPFCFACVRCIFIKRACFYKHHSHLCADDESDSEEEKGNNPSTQKAYVVVVAFIYINYNCLYRLYVITMLSHTYPTVDNFFHPHRTS